MKTPLKHMAASVLASLTIAVSANAAVVTWQAPATISADTDVLTTGSLVGAYIPGANALATTVNGVAFTSVFVANAYDNTTTTSLNFGSVATLAGAPGLYGFAQYESGTPSSLSTDYTKLFSGGVGPAAAVTTTFTLTLNNLTIGQAYLFQTWVNDSRGSVAGGRTETLTSGGSTSGTLAYNVGASDGSAGSFVIGSFTADSATQAITYNANNFAQINAFQLRADAVPEPSTYALVLGGIATLFLIRRRVQA